MSYGPELLVCQIKLITTFVYIILLLLLQRDSTWTHVSHLCYTTKGLFGAFFAWGKVNKIIILNVHK